MDNFVTYHLDEDEESGIRRLARWLGAVIAVVCLWIILGGLTGCAQTQAQPVAATPQDGQGLDTIHVKRCADGQLCEVDVSIGRDKENVYVHASRSADGAWQFTYSAGAASGYAQAVERARVDALRAQLQAEIARTDSAATRDVLTRMVNLLGGGGLPGVPLPGVGVPALGPPTSPPPGLQ